MDGISTGKYDRGEEHSRWREWGEHRCGEWVQEPDYQVYLEHKVNSFCIGKWLALVPQMWPLACLRLTNLWFSDLKSSVFSIFGSTLKDLTTTAVSVWLCRHGVQTDTCRLPDWVWEAIRRIQGLLTPRDLAAVHLAPPLLSPAAQLSIVNGARKTWAFLSVSHTAGEAKHSLTSCHQPGRSLLVLSCASWWGRGWYR